MRSASAALIALINSGLQEWVRADLYTFFKYDGSVLARYTDADLDLFLGGNTYLASGPVLTRDLVRSSLGIAEDEMVITINADASMLLGGVPWLKAIRDGALDGGRIQLERFLSDSWTNLTVGTVKWFSGRVAGIDVGRSGGRVSVKSDTQLLNIQFPVNLYQPACRWTLFGSGCSLNRASFSLNSSVASGSDRQTINCGLTQAAKFYDLGILQFTTGPNTGTWRMVRAYTVGQIVLSSPLINAPTIGDAFTISPGCDKQQATCGAAVSKIFTADAPTNVLTSAAHGLANDMAVRLATTGGLPAPLTTTDVYFVISQTTNTFKLSATLDGAEIDLTTNGTGTNSVVVAGKFGNLPNFGGQPYIPIAVAQ